MGDLWKYECVPFNELLVFLTVAVVSIHRGGRVCSPCAVRWAVRLPARATRCATTYNVAVSIRLGTSCYSQSIVIRVFPRRLTNVFFRRYISSEAPAADILCDFWMYDIATNAWTLLSPDTQVRGSSDDVVRVLTDTTDLRGPDGGIRPPDVFRLSTAAYLRVWRKVCHFRPS